MTPHPRSREVAPYDPLDEGPRISWGTALLVFLEVALAAPLAVLFFMGALDLLPFLAPLLVFLLLRIPGDLARAVAGTKPTGLAIEGPAKALAWASVPFGTAYVFTGNAGPGPLWLAGTGGALLALALWGHHARALQHAPRVARTEGTIGAALAPFALAAASTFLTMDSPWDVLVPAGVLVVAGALAARGIVRLHRTGGRHHEMEGWSGWYQSHFFRLSVLLAAVVVYLFIRDSLTGIIPYLFLFEYSFAVFVAAGILWSLRAFARKKATDGVPVGPHRRHEQAIERQGETRFDLTESAFGRYLENGDPADVQTLARRLEEEGIRATDALAQVLAHTPDRGVLLVHPGWLYAARLLVVFLFAWVAAATLPFETGRALALVLLAGGLYTAQWNRFGGPWVLKTTLGLTGLLIALQALSFTIGFGVLQTLPGMLGSIVLVGLALVHPLRAKKGRPVPRFLYQGVEPLDAIGPLIERYDRSALLRGAWLGALGIVVFIVTGELSRVVEAASLLFTLYLTMAFAFLLYPVLVTAGLRVGKSQARSRHAQARRQRESMLQTALEGLGRALIPPETRGPAGKRSS